MLSEPPTESSMTNIDRPSSTGIATTRVAVNKKTSLTKTTTPPELSFREGTARPIIGKHLQKLSKIFGVAKRLLQGDDVVGIY